MRIGYTEKEVGHMYYGKWSRMFEQYKKQWNMMQNRMAYKEKEEKSSVLDL